MLHNQPVSACGRIDGGQLGGAAASFRLLPPLSSSSHSLFWESSPGVFLLPSASGILPVSSAWLLRAFVWLFDEWFFNVSSSVVQYW